MSLAKIVPWVVVTSLLPFLLGGCLEENMVYTPKKMHELLRLGAPIAVIAPGQQVQQDQVGLFPPPPLPPPGPIGYAPTVSWVGTGTVLDVQGTVTSDRRYVIINARPQATVLNGFTNYFVTPTSPVGPSFPAPAPAPAAGNRSFALPTVAPMAITRPKITPPPQR